MEVVAWRGAGRRGSVPAEESADGAVCRGSILAEESADGAVCRGSVPAAGLTR